LFNDVFVLYLSGAAKMYNDKEIECKDKYGCDITIEFPILSPTYAIVRRYWKNGNKRQEEEYRNGKQHGKDTGWYMGGNKMWEFEYKNNKLHGKVLAWYKNGKIDIKRVYKNGVMIK